MENEVIEMRCGGENGTTSAEDGQPLNTDEERNEKPKSELLYGIEDTPVWYLSVALGFQHYLTMFGSTIAVPLIISDSLCIGSNNLAKSQLISTMFFVSGVITLLQTILGTRLPIIQGAAFSFLPPVLAILNSAQFEPCPDPGSNDSLSFDWRPRMREIQGSIMVASSIEMLIGLTGIIGFLMSYIGPLTVAPTITVIGLSLFGVSADNFAGTHWGISAMTIVLVILFSQHLRNVGVPIKYYQRKRTVKNGNDETEAKGGWCTARIKIFTLFPVILAVLLSWAVCAIITAAGGFPDSATEYGYDARTDINIGVLGEAQWFRVPYPGQWGLPTVTVAGVLGMFSGILASIIESIGDYYACARLCQIPPPPAHTMNRGIFFEGFGCLIAGAWGSGSGTTSYSENIGAIGITKVASRRVVQCGSIIMIVLAVIGKFGALFTTIPNPVVGGMFCVMFGMISAVGISNLQFVDLNSSRNLLVVGFAIFMGISVPEWVKKNEALISTGVIELDQIFLVLLQTGMFVAGLIAFVLDNSIPGTAEERGLLLWRNQTSSSGEKDGKESENCEQRSTKQDLSSYELPKCKCCKTPSFLDKLFYYVPICPGFKRKL